MAFVEATDRRVRVAVTVLRRPATPLRFLLLPMIHIGERRYYDAVNAHLLTCDLAVMEGQRGGGRGLLIGTIYYIARHLGVARLVGQEVNAAALGVPEVRPDLSLYELRRRLGRWSTDVDLSLAARWYVLWLLLVKPRKALSTLMPQLGQRRWLSPTDHVVLNQRDTLLVDALSQIHHDRATEPITVAVVYGAAHMVAVQRKLRRRHNYRAEHVEWLTVCELDP